MARRLDFIHGLKTKNCISSNVPDYTKEMVPCESTTDGRGFI